MNLLLLFAARVRLWRSRLWTRDGRRLRLREGAATLLLSLLLAGMLGWTLDAYFVQLAANGVGAGEAAVALGWIFSVAITALVVLDLHHVFAAMIAGPDLDLLRLAPLSRRDLSLLLLLDAVPHALPPMLSLALPAALAFQHAYGAASPATTALALLALFTAPVAIGLALALPIARLVPPRLMSETLGLLSTVTLVLAWLANSFLLPHVIPEYGGASDVLVTLTRALPECPAWSPAEWAARAMAGGEGAGRATVALAISLAAACAIAWASAWLHVETARRRGNASERARVVADGPVRIGASTLGAFLRRDWRLLQREWGVATDIALTAILWSLLPLVGTPMIPLDAASLGGAILLMLAVGLGHEIGSRALALERTGIAWAALSPLGPWGWIRARFLGAMVAGSAVLLAAGTVALATLSLEFTVAARCLMWGMLALPVATATGLWVGALFADPDWSHPRAMLRVPGRLLSALVMIVQTTGWIVLSQNSLEAPSQMALAGAAVAVTLAVPILLLAAGSALSTAPEGRA